jgi:hypothetical protein
MKKAILRRKSQRSYDGQQLKEEDEKKLITYLEEEKNLVGLYGNKVNIYYVKTIGPNVEKISTYGVVRKAPSYLVTVCKNDKEGMIDCGYVFEKLVLYLESIGVETCWLGGTYKRSQLNVPVGEGEIIPIISPVGYSATKRTFSDRTVRRIAKSNSRLNFDDLFFYKHFKGIITDDMLKERLEYVRVAPSASNKQPWRVVIDENDVAHFYIERTPNYGYGKLAYDIQMVDMGIAICHYEISKGSVEFIKIQPQILMLSDYSDYIISMK